MYLLLSPSNTRRLVADSDMSRRGSKDSVDFDEITLRGWVEGRSDASEDKKSPKRSQRDGGFTMTQREKRCQVVDQRAQLSLMIPVDYRSVVQFTRDKDTLMMMKKISDEDEYCLSVSSVCL